MVGCEKTPDTVQTIHVSPSSQIITESEIETIPTDTELNNYLDELKSDVINDINESLDEDTLTELKDSLFENDEQSQSLVEVSLVRVVDGDTYVVDLDGKETKVRLIGIDTPESVAPDSYQEKMYQVEEGSLYGLIVKYDNNGKQLWNKEYYVLSDTQFFDVVEDNGNYIVVGKSVYARKRR